jgi:hypothetical protein
MDLTKRLGLPADLLKQATEVLEGKKISHPNQKEISTAAPPEDEITAADFKALKAKKKYKVEGVDRSGKTYESPLFETEEQASALYNKIRKSAPISNLKIVEIDEASKPARKDIGKPGKHFEKIAKKASKPTRKDIGKPGKHFEKIAKEEIDQVEEAKELNKDNADDARAHDCAKHVVHEQWGVGETVPTMHADPDADGNIAWYDVMFEHGIEQNVPTSDLEITLSETHIHKKSKRMSEAAMSGDAGQGAKKDVKALKGKNKNVEMNPVTKEEVEQADEAMDKSMAYATGTKQAMKMTGDKPPLEKSTIKKAHKIAKAIIRNEEVESVDEGIEASRKVAKMVGNAPSPHGDNPAYKPTKVPAELKNKPPTPVKPFKVKEEVELEEADTKVRGRFGGVNITHSTHGAFKAEYEPDAHTVDTPEAAVDIEVKHPDGKKSNLMMDHNGLKHQSGPKLPAEVHAALEKHAGKYRKNSLVGTNKLEEGRTMNRTTAVLTQPNHPLYKAARAKFDELTGGKGNADSYFHRTNKYKDHAEAAVAHAEKSASSGSSESEPSHDDVDTEANKHPINQLRGIADRGGGKFMGKDITRSHANKLLSMHDSLKPAQKQDFVSNIGKHLSNVMS